jgi:DNA-binding CsgD family transcriptional regulator
MKPTEVKGRTVPSALGLTLFAASLILMAVDVAADAMGAGGWLHVLLEALVMIVLVIGASVFARQRVAERMAIQAATLRASELALAEAKWREEARRWRNEAEAAARGLTEAIDRQFERWGLSEAEREVGFLLLKGLSLKEAADVRGTSERTVRQQAQAIYRKAGLGGRAELAAFFLEDLLAPP